MLRRAKRWFLGLSLAHKLTILIMVASGVSMTTLCAMLGWYDARTLRARLVEETQVLVDMLAASSTAAMAFGDAAAAGETLRIVAVDHRVAFAALLRPDGRIFSSYAPRQPNHENPGDVRITAQAVAEGAQPYMFLESRLAMSSPIVLKDETIGRVYVELDLGELHARLWTLWCSLAFGLLGTVVLAGVIGWRLQRLISAPMRHLGEITRAVIRDRTYSVRAAATTDDEIGQLSRSFNEMLDHIQQRDATLERHRQELERTVNTRTAELKANMERYRLLVEGTHAVPWEIDGTTYAFSYISPQVTSLVGYDSQSLINGRSLIDLIYPDDRVRILNELAALSSTDRTDLDHEYRVQTAAGRVIHVQSVVTANRQANDGSVILRGITVDVTQQKKLELELRQAQKLESVGRLAAGVAHEINTPIQFVTDSVHFVRDAMRDLMVLIHEYEGLRAAIHDGPPATIRAVDRVARAARDADLDYMRDNVPKALDRSLDGLTRVAKIVRSMKEFAYPDRTEMAPVDLNQAIQSTLTIARSEYKYVADVETDFGDLPCVTCHGGDFNQVILNLLVNAAHAIEDAVAGTGNRGSITIRTRQVGADAIVTVSDTGCGIPEEIRNRIFDPFFTTKDVGRGTGQGLAIARAVIVEKHGGELTFETQVGKGTIFVVRLPIGGRTGSGLAA